MKKRVLLTLMLVITSFLFLIHLAHLAIAETPDQLIQQQVGFNPNNIPSSQQDVNNIANKYLKQEWSKVLAKLPIIGPIHNYFLAHPLVFKILFNYNYEISFVFFLILFLWVYFAIIDTRIFRSIGLLKKGWQNAIIGVGISIILAQINLFKNISLFFLNIVFSDKAWWIRLIMWVGLLVFAWLFALISRMVGKWKIKREKQQREAEVARKAERAEQFIKSAEEGKKLRESIEPNTREKMWKRFLGYNP